MPRQYIWDISQTPPLGLTRIWREYGDANQGAAPVVHSRLEAYYAAGLAYREVAVDNDGHLQVDVLTGGGGGGGGGTEYTEDDPSAADPTGGQLMARRRDTLSGEVSADGDVVALNSTNKGELYVKHVDQIGISGTVPVDSELPAAAALADGASNPTAPAVGAFNLMWNGTGWDRVRGNTTDGLRVDSELPAAAALADGASNPTAPAVGAFNLMWNGTGWDRIRGTSTDGLRVAQATASALNAQVQGAAAHDAAVSGNPLLMGLEGRTSDGTPVTSGRAVRGLADTLGKQVVLVGAIHDLQSNGNVTLTDTTAQNVIAAGGAGVRIAVMSVLVTNGSASVDTKVEIRDGTTVRIIGHAERDGGGFSMCATRPLFISTANTAITARCATAGADVDVFVSGYRIAN